MCPDSHWLNPDLLPGYSVSRSSIRVNDYGKKHGCPEPQLGRSESGELAYWVKPAGHPAAVRLRIEGLQNFFL